mmetsp:Transcript_58091/g.85139  ORF Transcript_58091/g.85139 Transcript_58091/m.85139 type:complete len:115 (-) Transcript_58091:9-353(-)
MQLDLQDARGLNTLMSLYDRGDVSASEAAGAIDGKLKQLGITRELTPSLCVAIARLQTAADRRRVDPLPSCMREIFRDSERYVVFETLWADKHTVPAEALWTREQALRAAFRHT